MDKPQQDINLRYTVPLVVSDGHVIAINDNGVPSVMFFQGREQHEGHIHGDVVAAVRLNNIDDLKALSKAIDDTIRQHKSREP
jgi:hypothetical protein